MGGCYLCAVSASLKRLRHGTRLAFEDGRLVRVEERGGAEQVTLAWDGGVLVGIEVPGPRVTLVRGERVAHLLFGEAQPIVVSPAAEPATWVGAIDWARPVQIPPIEHPARLPPGAGTTILNTIAWLAELGGVERLRYAGPYPTSALWGSLMQSFRVDGAGDEAAFTADALARAARADMSPVPIAFTPAPFERLSYRSPRASGAAAGRGADVRCGELVRRQHGGRRRFFARTHGRRCTERDRWIEGAGERGAR